MKSHSVKDLSEIAFFLILFGYIGLLIVNLPGGGPGLMPSIVFSIVIVLLGYRLIVLLFPDLESLLQENFRRVVDVSAFEILNVDNLQPDTSIETIADEGSELREVFDIVVWIVAGVSAIYLLGHLIGGFLFVAVFLYVYGDHSPGVSVGTAIGTSVVIVGLNEVFTLALWSGLLVRIL